MPYLNAVAWAGCKHFGAQLFGEVAGPAPGQAIVDALDQEGAGDVAVIVVSAKGVDQKHRACLLINHHRAQVQPVRNHAIIHNEGRRAPGNTWEWGTQQQLLLLVLVI